LIVIPNLIKLTNRTPKQAEIESWHMVFCRCTYARGIEKKQPLRGCWWVFFSQLGAVAFILT